MVGNFSDSANVQDNDYGENFIGHERPRYNYTSFLKFDYGSPLINLGTKLLKKLEFFLISYRFPNVTPLFLYCLYF